MPVFDTVAGPITVFGTNGNDAIAYNAPTNPAHQGLVSINNLETIEFGNKTGLTINSLNGTDTVSINNTTAQTGLVNGTTVNGGDPAAGDTLIVSGTTAADNVTYTPTGTGTGTVALTPSGGTALPLVTFTNMGGLTYNGQGGPDALDRRRHPGRRQTLASIWVTRSTRGVCWSTAWCRFRIATSALRVRCC